VADALHPQHVRSTITLGSAQPFLNSFQNFSMDTIPSSYIPKDISESSRKDKREMSGLKRRSFSSLFGCFHFRPTFLASPKSSNKSRSWSAAVFLLELFCPDKEELADQFVPYPDCKTDLSAFLRGIVRTSGRLQGLVGIFVF